MSRKAPRAATLAGGLAVLLAATVSGCGRKACEPIPQSAAVKSLGFVLEGGQLCEDKDGGAIIDYPGASGDTLGDLHKNALVKAGWKVESAAQETMLLSRGDDMLFVVTGKSSKQRGLPFAVVRYCHDEGCRLQLIALAEALKKTGR
jgi:hypothetical protein